MTIKVECVSFHTSTGAATADDMRKELKDCPQEAAQIRCPDCLRAGRTERLAVYFVIAPGHLLIRCTTCNDRRTVIEVKVG